MSDWTTIGTTGVSHIWSHIFHFLSVFTVISIIFTVAYILGTETFVIVTGIVVMWIDSENLRRCAEKKFAMGQLVFEGCG